MTTVVLGLDGASFELLEPWIADGTLPALKRLRTDADVPNMHILDIAPTVLHARDVAVPTNMDGRPRTGIFAPGSEPASREVRTQQSADDEADATAMDESAVSERLRDLGYIE